ncbi:MAG: ABC transporter substrate-binding protein, partial [Thermodesulfobacteriaceae bacterium]|nr:ABC transporter substrate-binding protein [Thermodesulfobacteriaceae bacterium]
SGDKPTYVAGNYWGEQDIRRLAGGIPTPDDIKQFFSILPLEKIISLNPDVILISHLATYSEEDILNNPQWKNISAVKHKRVYKNPYQIGGIYTPRVVLLLAWTAKKIYPELNIDWVNISDDFFKKFYGIGYYGEKE